jgi:putative inorganic carbon (HCO3(-)) transporter
MLGTGLGHFIPIIAYLGFWIMALISLGGKPLYGLYYMIPFLPYRTLRDHLLDYPLGESMLTILVLCVIVGALIHGKRLPKSKLYVIWLVFGIYLYISLWLGTAISNAPAPLSSSDINFLTWKGYMLIPLIFAAAGLVIEDRKAVRTVVLLTAFSVLLIDRSSLVESMSHSWANFDENKRSGGPLGFGSNQTAAYLAEFAMFFWGFSIFVKRRKVKLAGYLLAAATILTAMYCFSRAGYLAILFGVLVLGIFKDRKLLLVLGGFLLVWQSVVPTAVRERVNMTQNSNGQLEASAQERVDLWSDAEKSIEQSPIVGDGFATFQLGQHVDNLRDTHNWYVKVMIETGIIGLVFALMLLEQMLAVSYRLFRRATDPLYRGLGLGLFLAIFACIVANFFGDRWTYVEITAPLWVLISAAIRAKDLMEVEPVTVATEDASVEATNPYYA